MLQPGMVVAPIPLHWMRLLKRRFNQAAVLSGALAQLASLAHCPDLLVRRRSTGSQEGRDRDGRFRNMHDAIAVHPKRLKVIEGKHALLVDDVMTSGATLAAAAEACIAAGAIGVCVLVLARVAKDA